MEMMNLRKKVIIASLILFIIAVIIMISLYISEVHFRDWIDANILRKDLTEQDLPTISLNTDKQNQVHVYSKYIALLNNKVITLYNKFGEEVTTIDVDINTAEKLKYSFTISLASYINFTPIANSIAPIKSTNTCI